MKHITPDITLRAFHCPLCGTYAHMDWTWLYRENIRSDYLEAMCSHCIKPSLWRCTKTKRMQTALGGIHFEALSGEMLYPNFGTAPLPEQDMPDNVKSDYLEAAKIYSKSPRGAAALLRLGLQNLCVHLGEKGENINDDIRELAKKNTLPPLVINVADTVRITGNNAVHPGEMSNEDVDYVASKMFELLNFIVKKGITEPIELKALYEMTPESPRKSAENKDSKSKKN